MGTRARVDVSTYPHVDEGTRPLGPPRRGKGTRLEARGFGQPSARALERALGPLEERERERPKARHRRHEELLDLVGHEVQVADGDELRRDPQEERDHRPKAHPGAPRVLGEVLAEDVAGQGLELGELTDQGTAPFAQGSSSGTPTISGVWCQIEACACAPATASRSPRTLIDGPMTQFFVPGSTG